MFLGRGQVLGTGRGGPGPAAAAAGVTPVSWPVLDMTADGGYDNAHFSAQLGAVVAGARAKFEVYTCDDAAGTNPVLVTASDWVVPVAKRSIRMDLVGTPGYFILVKLIRDTQNITVNAGSTVQYGRRSGGNNLDPHVTVPWN
jgi:hypothetical protein